MLHLAAVLQHEFKPLFHPVVSGNYITSAEACPRSFVLLVVVLFVCAGASRAAQAIMRPPSRDSAMLVGLVMASPARCSRASKHVDGVSGNLLRIGECLQFADSMRER